MLSLVACDGCSDFPIVECEQRITLLDELTILDVAPALGSRCETSRNDGSERFKDPDGPTSMAKSSTSDQCRRYRNRSDARSRTAALLPRNGSAVGAIKVVRSHTCRGQHGSKS
jgi:hypothetical protein